jgi:Holliday junction resolvase
MAIKWLENENKQKKSKRQERKLAKKLKESCFEARTQAGSGSLWGAKGDVRTRLNLIECKRTDKTQLILKESWLDKLRKEAIKDNRIPVMAIEIGLRRYFIVEDCYLT